MNIGPILRAMKHNRTRVVLIVLEIAITLAIVTNCINVILAEREKMSQKSGFDDDNILWMRERPFSPEFRKDGVIESTIDADLRTIAAIPGVHSAANTHFQLWEGGGSSTGVKPFNENRAPVGTQGYFATKDIMETLGVKIIEGRAFKEGDHAVGAAPDPMNVVIISKKLADVLYPKGGAVGQAIHEASDNGQNPGPPMTVVGVMESFYNPFGMPGTSDDIADRAMFVPARVGGSISGMSYLIRVEPGAMSSVTAEIEKRLAAQNPNRVFEFQSTAEKKSKWFAGNKIIVTTMTCIIIALIAVTALGLLGLTSLAVSERTKQIGTRRALGATRGAILRHFITENLLVTTAGLALGVIAAYALNFLLVSQVSDVKLPWQLVAAGMVLLWINGVVSTIPPAMRAMMVSPAIATRSV